MATYTITAGERTWTYPAFKLAELTGLPVADVKTLKSTGTASTESEDVKTAFEALGVIGTLEEAIAEP
jgi:hypothetical protein